MQVVRYKRYKKKCIKVCLYIIIGMAVANSPNVNQGTVNIRKLSLPTADNKPICNRLTATPLVRQLMTPLGLSSTNVMELYRERKYQRKQYLIASQTITEQPASVAAKSREYKVHSRTRKHLLHQKLHNLQRMSNLYV